MKDYINSQEEEADQFEAYGEENFDDEPPLENPDEVDHYILAHQEPFEGKETRLSIENLEKYNLYKMSIHEKRARLSELYGVFGMNTVGG